MIGGKLLSASAAVQPTFIEDVFSTYLYTGNGSTQTINNGIDLAGEGGLVWSKPRATATLNDHILMDSERGDFQIQTNTTAANNAIASFNFSSTGYVVPNNNRINQSGITYASWTFRQAPRFFDVVTYTGTGANRTIAHDLGVVPGCVIVKRTDTTGDWQVYHRSNTAAPETDYLVLNSTAATVDSNTRWNDTLPTSTVFSLGTDATVNASGGTYVAYLFAHDPLGPSGDGSDGLIACGSYTGNGLTTGPVVNLGWEPQWLLVKRTNAAGYEWNIFDNMRGIISGANDPGLYANSSAQESSPDGFFDLLPNGFQYRNPAGVGGLNDSGAIVTYIAIRRGPMREPTVGTEVYNGITRTGTGAVATVTGVGFPPDLYTVRSRSLSNDSYFADRLRGSSVSLVSQYSFDEASVATSVVNSFDMNGVTIPLAGAMNNTTSATYIDHFFRRAPGFFDVVAYTGDGTLNPIGHNLTVNPELIIFKRRGSVQDWWVIHYATDKSLRLNTTAAGTTADASIYGPVTPTTFVPYLNTAGLTHISYHFASLPGISKVGSYTGNGSSQTINCAFTTGARFVLIKRTDSTGDWYVWDTARGIVSGNDPHLSLNTTAAEVTTDDTIDPDNSGFIVNQVSATNVNVNAATYIYLAIA